MFVVSANDAISQQGVAVKSNRLAFMADNYTNTIIANKVISVLKQLHSIRQQSAEVMICAEQTNNKKPCRDARAAAR